MVNIHISEAAQIHCFVNINVAIEFSDTTKHAYYIF